MSDSTYKWKSNIKCYKIIPLHFSSIKIRSININKFTYTLAISVNDFINITTSINKYYDGETWTISVQLINDWLIIHQCKKVCRFNNE